jgi:hypothetical protein
VDSCRMGLTRACHFGSLQQEWLQFKNFRRSS